jgi:hypothetical protein
MLNNFRPGDWVIHPDDPEPGIVQNIDHETGMVLVDFKVNGEYGHPNGIADVDPSELALVHPKTEEA